MKTIGFISGMAGNTFLEPIVEVLRSKYTVVPMLGLRRDWIEQADVLWCEWGDAGHLAAPYLEGLRGAGKRLICRIHSYEVFEPWFAETDWSQFTDLIFVADHVKQYAERTAKLSGVRCHVIWNGIDVAKYPLNPLAQKGPRNIAVYGSINHKKGPQLAIHAFQSLRRSTRADWRLNFIGPVQEQRYVEYLGHAVDSLGLGACVQVLPPGPPATALADQHYIACFSPWEGCPVGLLEGMAMGLAPLIHDFPGALAMYSKNWLWRSIDEFVALANQRRGSLAGENYRQFVADNFSQAKQIELIAAVVEGE